MEEGGWKLLLVMAENLFHLPASKLYKLKILIPN